MVSAVQDESGVTAVLQDMDAGKSQMVRAEYLVAADGVHGRTREAVTGQRLLDTYHAERHPVGRFSARQSVTGPTLAMMRVDANMPALPAEKRRRCSTCLSATDIARPQWWRPNPNPRIPTKCSWSKAARATWNPRPAHLGPAWWPTRLDARSARSPFHVVHRRRWCLMAPGCGENLSRPALPITEHRIGSQGEMVDIDGGWAATAGLSGDGALLVRPDDFVGWRADTARPEPTNDLHRALSMILGRS